MRTKSDLRPYQQRVVTALYEHDALQAVLPMGAGKTACALTAVQELLDEGEIRAALVLAPKKVAQLVWPAEASEWEHLSGLCVQLVAGTPIARLAALNNRRAQVYVMGVDNTQWLVDEVLAGLSEEHHFFDCLIIDESSRFKSPRSKRAKALMKLRRRFRNVWGLTGTPRPNGFEDQFKPLTLLTNGRLWGKSFDVWRNQRFISDYQGYNWTIRPEWVRRTVAEINSVSITIGDDDMPELPELNTVTHWVDLPPEARRVYNEMKRHLLAQLDSGLVTAANAAVATGKLAQIAQGFLYGDGNEDVTPLHTEKSDLLVELLEDLNEPALVVYEYVEDLRILQRLWPGLPYLGAGTTPQEAERHQSDWNAGRLPVLALHPASAGHGLNLQHGGRHIFWYGMTWSAEMFDQTTKRIHRPGQKGHCFNHLLLARDTVDEAKLDVIVNKMRAQDAFVKHMRKA